ncbi:MAG: DUF4132 domain-containing protein [Bacteroidales bacterium]|nr:DUF4132 domain-containing protein [Bacteroidales bacterium]
MNEKIASEIHQLAELYISRIQRNTQDSIKAQTAIDLIKICEKAIINEVELDYESLMLLGANQASETISFITYALERHRETPDGENRRSWDTSTPLINQLMRKEISRNKDGLARLVNNIIAEKFTEETDLDRLEFVNYLHNKGFSDKEIVAIVITNTNPYSTFYYHTPSWKDKETTIAETEFTHYVKELMQPKSSFLGIKTRAIEKEFIDSLIFYQNYNKYKIYPWFRFLHKHYPECIKGDYYKYLFYSEYDNYRMINFETLYYLIDVDIETAEPLAIRLINECKPPIQETFSIYLALSKKLKDKYHSIITELGETYYNSEFKELNKTAYYYHHDKDTLNGPFSVAYAQYLLEYSTTQGIKRIGQFVEESAFLHPHFIEFLDNHLKEKCVPYLVKALVKEPVRDNYHSTIFDSLAKYDCHNYLPQIIEFMVVNANNKTRKLSAHVLQKYSETIFPIAANLVVEKTVDQRITGAIILAELNSNEANITLNGAVDKEVNDDTRDIMLEALTEKRFAKPYTMAMVEDMVKTAETRKKLSKWNEKWIDEDKLPGLFWQGGKKKLSQTDIRFLLYRMKRAKGINSDIEAKQMLNLIDRNTSGKFAKAILSAFQDSNSDTKLKYYLTLAGLLGDDDIMHTLNALFKKNIADSRIKMAEYIIGALAMIGSNKALRIVEVISRKFTNKKPTISTAALDALTAAASELNITTDELADRIIPNFEFDGLYKKFDVDGEEYRAFISSDFTLNYLSESNKLRKSAPANTPKELKAEFKEIEKEIRDIVKSQSDRLERYMLDERRWNAANWHEFFFLNPIMFVYATKLIWGIFDKDNTLLDVFYCSEDSSLYNLADDEITLDNDTLVGIIHPIYLTEDDRTKWHDKIYDMNLSTAFPQIERPIFTVNEDEKESNITRRFAGKKVPKGADFVNTFMVKKNWYKSSGDGGSSEFTKWYKNIYKAHPYIEGPVAFYLGDKTPAIVHEVYFGTTNYKEHVKIKDLPPIFYSEIMADIDQLLKTE